jgi:hypothetical protein
MTHKNVRLEYTVRCGRCQCDIVAGEPHDLLPMNDGKGNYRHQHAKCAGEEPFQSNSISEVSDAVGTIASAAVGYFLGRLNRRH